MQSRLMAELANVPGRRDKKGFFPETTFTEIIHEQSVREELNRYPKSFHSDTVEQITEIICGDKPYRKIFTLLVVINKLADIKLFIDDDVSDECLPLLRVSRPDSENTFQLGDSPTSTRPVRQIGLFADWDAIDVWTFEEWQWTTISPVLKRGSRRNIKHLRLRPEISLPFTEDCRYSSGSDVIEGGFSTVFKVHIHPANHHFRGPEVSCPGFGRKTLLKVVEECS